MVVAAWLIIVKIRGDYSFLQASKQSSSPGLIAWSDVRVIGVQSLLTALWFNFLITIYRVISLWFIFLITICRVRRFTNSIALIVIFIFLIGVVRLVKQMWVRVSIYPRWYLRLFFRISFELVDGKLSAFKHLDLEKCLLLWSLLFLSARTPASAVTASMVTSTAVFLMIYEHISDYHAFDLLALIRW